MAYSVKADILELLPESVLIQLTDDENLKEVRDSRVNEGIEQADAVIDSYISGKYTTPVSPVPNLIKAFSVNIAIYNLYSRRVETMPEARRDRYNDAIKQLDAISKGTMTLGTAPGVTAVGEIQINTTYDDDRIFTRELPSDGSTGTLDNY